MDKTIVFDYDGTIHDTMHIYKPAFLRCKKHLEEAGFIEFEEVSDERIKSWLGMNARDMWLDYHPELPEEIREKASSEIGKYMYESVLNNEAAWYEGAEKSLKILKESGFKLVILSNSKKMDGVIHFEKFDMPRYFEKWYDCESYNWAPKTEIIRSVIADYHDTVILVGDRSSDIDAAKSAGIISIGCTYGYGSKKELEKADFFANDVSDIPKIVRTIIN